MSRALWTVGDVDGLALEVFADDEGGYSASVWSDGAEVAVVRCPGFVEVLRLVYLVVRTARAIAELDSLREVRATLFRWGISNAGARAAAVAAGFEPEEIDERETAAQAAEQRWGENRRTKRAASS